MTSEQVAIYIRDLLWDGPLLLLLLGVGIYQTITLKGLQFRYLKHSLNLLFHPFQYNRKSKKKRCPKGDIPSFQSLMTALAGSIGTGNITGIATAVVAGGFGSIFWMWMMACLGMATAYSETLLGVKYRHQNAEGDMIGGPMYSLRDGLNLPKVAALYSILGGIAAVSIGCIAQSHSMVDAIQTVYSGDRIVIGIVIAILVGAVVIGGVKKIGKVAGFIVPFMAIAYIVAGLFVLGWHYEHILPAFGLIIKSAFTGQAAAGGLLGGTIMIAMQNGVQYGVFANEAGLGSLAIAGASAQIKHPAEQGMMSISGVFVATMIICTITGLVLAVTNVVGMETNGVLIEGSPLAVAAFSSVHSSFRYVVIFGLSFFAFTTMLAWSYYGEKCFEYLFGIQVAHIYRWLFTVAVVIGAVMELKIVWAIASIATGLMALPNLIAIVGLSKGVKQDTKEYIELLQSSRL